ncbi:MAG: ABC transporter permease subunit [Syntrophobacteraceae bacterium]|nr:ABC transporter permease subunit [Desulfobacteraceae bacterium]
MERILSFAAAVSAVSILSILFLLLYFSLPLFTEAKVFEVLATEWQPFGGRYGILPMCAASLVLAVLSLAMAFPLAVGVCCLTHTLAPGRAGRLLLAVVHFMTGIPTVIYGFVSVFLLVPRMRTLFDVGSGFSLLTASLTLSLLILPTIVLVFHARLGQLDPRLRLAAEAMGFTPVQQLRHVFIPAAREGLTVAAVLGFGRAIGDTLISLMLAGNAPLFPHSPFASVRTLSSHIALVLATDSRSMAYQSVFASGLILFLVAGAVNFIIGKAGRKTRRHAHD